MGPAPGETARPHPGQIAIAVMPKKRRRITRQPPGRGRLDTVEPGLRKIPRIDHGTFCANQISSSVESYTRGGNIGLQFYPHLISSGPYGPPKGRITPSEPGPLSRMWIKRWGHPLRSAQQLPQLIRRGAGLRGSLSTKLTTQLTAHLAPVVVARDVELRHRPRSYFKPYERAALINGRRRASASPEPRARKSNSLYRTEDRLRFTITA